MRPSPDRTSSNTSGPTSTVARTSKLGTVVEDETAVGVDGREVVAAGWTGGDDEEVLGRAAP